MAHKGLWEKLEKLDGISTAKRAKCNYHKESESYLLKMLNTEYVVNISYRTIFSVQPDSQQKPAKFLEQLCLLAYLINAQDLPLANKLVSAQALPGGQFFFRGLHSIPTEKLENIFGQNPRQLFKSSEPFDAKECEFGDASIQLYVLPRIPLTIIIWRKCEEFDARASILFDQTASSELPLDALLAAVNLTVEALIKKTTEGR